MQPIWPAYPKFSRSPMIPASEKSSLKNFGLLLLPFKKSKYLVDVAAFGRLHKLSSFPNDTCFRKVKSKKVRVRVTLTPIQKFQYLVDAAALHHLHKTFSFPNDICIGLKKATKRWALGYSYAHSKMLIFGIRIGFGLFNQNFLFPQWYLHWKN